MLDAENVTQGAGRWNSAKPKMPPLPDLVQAAEARSDDNEAVRAWLKRKLAQAETGIYAEMVRVTPKIAAFILAECNAGNRSLRKAAVARFAQAMADGRWRETAETVWITIDGQLNNGQHRLSAIVEAGATVPLFVAFGGRREGFAVLGTGGRRTGGDALKIAGFSDGNAIAAVVRAMMNIARKDHWNTRHVDNDQIVAWRQANDVQESLRAALTAYSHVKSGSPTGYIVAHILISRGTKFPNRLPQFWESLTTGAGLSKTDPILTLREGLRGGKYRASDRGGTADGIFQAAIIIIAWNKWLRGLGRQGLKWSPTLQFPSVE